MAWVVYDCASGTSTKCSSSAWASTGGSSACWSGSLRHSAVEHLVLVPGERRERVRRANTPCERRRRRGRSRAYRSHPIGDGTGNAMVHSGLHHAHATEDPIAERTGRAGVARSGQTVSPTAHAPRQTRSGTPDCRRAYRAHVGRYRGRPVHGGPRYRLRHPRPASAWKGCRWSAGPSPRPPPSTGGVAWSGTARLSCRAEEFIQFSELVSAWALGVPDAAGPRPSR